MSASTCTTTGKVIYRTRSKAIRSLSRLKGTNTPVRGIPYTERSAYQCPDCGFWHLSSRAQDKRPFEEKLPTVPKLAQPQPAQPWEPRPRRKP